MRVLAFCDYFHPNSQGGAERVAGEIYRRAAASGVDLHVVGIVPSSFLDGDGLTTNHVEHVAGFGVELVAGTDLTGILGAQLTVAPGQTRRARRLIASLRPDVVHVNGLHFHSTFAGVRAAKAAAVPIVATAHLGGVESMPGRATIASVAYDRYPGGWAARSSDRVLAVSESVRHHVLRLGVDAQRVTVAPNGVDHDRFHAIGRSPRVEALRVALVGRLVANKGVADALDAVAAAREAGTEIRLEIIGDGPLMAQTKQRAAAPDLAGAVHFTGAVPDVARHLRNVDVLMRPSYTEGLPLAVLEAMACGVVVICSDVPGNVELIGGHEPIGVIAQRGDVAALADGLVRLQEDRALLERWAARGVERAAVYTWDATARAHVEAWQDLAMRKTSKSGVTR